jgi:hypothetical protein
MMGLKNHCFSFILNKKEDTYLSEIFNIGLSDDSDEGVEKKNVT